MSYGYRTTIEECADMDPDKMQAKLCYVRLDNLSTLLGRKVNILIL